MPNSLLNKAEFEATIQKMPDRQLIEFIATEVYDMCRRCDRNETRLDALERRNVKFTGTVGGLSAVIGGAIAAVVDYFASRV